MEGFKFLPLVAIIIAAIFGAAIVVRLALALFSNPNPNTTVKAGNTLGIVLCVICIILLLIPELRIIGFLGLITAGVLRFKSPR